MTATAVLAIGGNLGDRIANIESATQQIGELAGVQIKNISPLVESHALTEDGTDESKPNYLNGVIEIETELQPLDLLNQLREIEQAHGRIRDERWGSRTIDIDIITFDDQQIDEPQLQVPHPRAHERAFVLVPWSIMDTDAELLGHGKVTELAEPIRNQVWVHQ